MDYKKGFSLVSFLLYLMIFTLTTFLMCHIITALIIPSFFSLRKNQSIIALHIATDFFVRDIHALKNGNYSWKVILPHELIWHHNDHDIGWSFSHNQLERREGIYNGNWHQAKASIIARGLSRVRFNPEKEAEHIIGLELVLISECAPEKPVISYVALKNRRNDERNQ
jgi:hypothetical protein